MAKAKNINGSIKEFSSLPNTYGNIISGFGSLSDEDLAKWGFYDIEVDSEYNSKIHIQGDISFDSSKKKFVKGKSNKTWSDSVAQMKTQKIIKLKKLAMSNLAETDWYVIRKAELGTSIPSSVTTARAAIRSTVETKTDEINALSTKVSLILYDNSI